MNTDLATMYKLFGVENYAAELSTKANTAKLEQLNRILTKYILSKAVDDFPEEHLDLFETTDIKNEHAVLTLFQTYIPHFSSKLADYGRSFRGEFSRYGLTS